jgi:hypothetical protein
MTLYHWATGSQHSKGTISLHLQGLELRTLEYERKMFLYSIRSALNYSFMTPIYDGVMNEQFNSIKIHGINDVKIIIPASYARRMVSSIAPL